MGLENNIGRVGALAVALGIGAAVAAMPGVAWAEPDTSGAAAVSHSSEGSAPGGVPLVRRPAHSDRPAGRAGSTTSSAAGDDSADSLTGSARPHRGRAGQRFATTDTPAIPAIPGRLATRKPGTPTSSSETARRPVRSTMTDHPGSDGSAPDPASAVSSGASIPSGEHVVSPSGPASPVTGTARDDIDTTTTPLPAPRLATMLKTLFSPRAVIDLTNTPEAPDASPLLWTMLTAARREFTERAEAVPTAAVTGMSQSAAAAAAAPGRADGPVVVGADGTLYLVTTNATGTRVSILDSSGQVITTTDYLPGGNLTGQGGSFAARPDGTLLVSTTRGGFGNRSTISAIDSEGTVTTVARLTGETSGLTVGADGAVYTKTFFVVPFIPYGSYNYHVVRISPTGATRSLPYDTTVTLADDGTAYLLSTVLGTSSLHVFTPAGKSRTIAIPYSPTNLGNPVLGPDGTYYLTANVKAFGNKDTRVYTVNGTTSTARTLPGLAGVTVVAPNGVYLETHTYDGAKDNGVDGTTYISKLTRDSVSTLAPITGRITRFQVTAAGAIYAPIVTPSATTATVAVFDSSGNRTTVVLPGTMTPTDGYNFILGGGPHADEAGYVRYDSGGVGHVAVLNADGTVTRIVDLPVGTTADDDVFYGPDGAPYLLLRYRVDSRPPGVAGSQIIALSSDTLSPVVAEAGSFDSADVQFAPDGTGYLLTDADLPDTNDGLTLTGFNANGATGTSLVLGSPYISYFEQPILFAPDGTGFVLDRGSATTPRAVYALSSSGVTTALELPNDTSTSVYGLTIGTNGTPYLTTYSETDGTTTVTPITPPSVV